MVGGALPSSANKRVQGKSLNLAYKQTSKSTYSRTYSNFNGNVDRKTEIPSSNIRGH
jgi:hypothetical protein